MKKGLVLLVAVFMMAQMTTAFAKVTVNTGDVCFSDDFEDAIESASYWTISDTASIQIANGQASNTKDNYVTKSLKLNSEYAPKGSYTVDANFSVTYGWTNPNIRFLINSQGSNPTKWYCVRFRKNVGVELCERNGYNGADKAFIHQTYGDAYKTNGTVFVTIVYDDVNKNIKVYCSPSADQEKMKVLDYNTKAELGVGEFAVESEYCKWSMNDIVIRNGIHVPGAEPTPTVEAVGASAQHDGQTGTVRFTSKVTGGGAAKFGASVLPTWIFDRDGGLTNAEPVTIESPIADGQTYGVDVTGIPAEQFHTEIYAKPFIYVNDEVKWADTAIQSSVNSAIAAK